MDLVPVRVGGDDSGESAVLGEYRVTVLPGFAGVGQWVVSFYDAFPVNGLDVVFCDFLQLIVVSKSVMLGSCDFSFTYF